MAYYRTDICYTTGSFGKDWNIAKATTSQIQDILSKVAIHKGFKKGVKYKNACDCKHEVVCPSSDFVYSTSSSYSGIFANSNRFEGQGWIYCNGKWAEIVEDIPEYVKLVSNIGSHKIGFMSDNSEFHNIRGRVFNTKVEPTMVFGMADKNWKDIWEMYSYNFQVISKEAFDAQFKSDYLVYHTVENNTGTIDIGIDGKISNVSISDNNVKINYLK
jgi:hypothetical protein